MSARPFPADSKLFRGQGEGRRRDLFRLDDSEDEAVGGSAQARSKDTGTAIVIRIAQDGGTGGGEHASCLHIGYHLRLYGAVQRTRIEGR